MSNHLALAQVLPPRAAHMLALIQARAGHDTLYLVGGAVRDALMGITKATINGPDIDLDIAVVGDGPAFAKRLAAEYGGVVQAHQAFGTAIWECPQDLYGAPIDFATTRTETYAKPAALPTVTLLNTADAFSQDALRRDFTINAIAVDLADGKIHDPQNGLADLQMRALRVLHAASFSEDPTRVLRAARFAGRFGFTLAPETAAILPTGLANLSMLSGERSRHEIDLIFQEAYPENALVLLSTWEAWPKINAGLTFPQFFIKDIPLLWAALRRLLEGPLWRLPAPDPAVVGWALLAAFISEPAAVGHALQCPRKTLQAMQITQALWAKIGYLSRDLRPSQVVQFLEGTSEASLLTLAALCRNTLAQEKVLRYACDWQFIKAETTGNDLKALGVPPGPRYQQWLWRLRAARLDGELADGLAEQHALRQWLSKGEG
jgi:tRNA nucleotidyltransferase (CCA-adding enzyme)